MLDFYFIFPTKENQTHAYTCTCCVPYQLNYIMGVGLIKGWAWGRPRSASTLPSHIQVRLNWGQSPLRGCNTYAFTLPLGYGQARAKRKGFVFP